MDMPSNDIRNAMGAPERSKLPAAEAGGVAAIPIRNRNRNNYEIIFVARIKIVRQERE